jgi:hypothetical protein
MVITPLGLEEASVRVSRGKNRNLRRCVDNRTCNIDTMSIETKPHKQRTGHNVDHIAMINCRIKFLPLLRLQGLQHAHCRTVYVTR